MNKHIRRCPATHLRIGDGQIQGSDRCQKPAGHEGSHEHDGYRWSFVEGSYSGRAEDSADYAERLEATE